MGDRLGIVLRGLIPEGMKPSLRTIRRAGRRVLGSLATPMRAHAYGSPDSWWLRSLPAYLRRRWRFESPPPGSRRIEVGSGWQPQPGYIHAEVDPDFPCVDILVSGHSLPVRDDWADEVLNVHMIEHISPLVLRRTLQEWFRVLRNGGQLRIHTPNGEALGRTLVDSASGASTPFWAIQSAIFGYFREIPECTGPEGLRDRGDHRLVFTFPVLRTLLEEAGFSQVADISGKEPCSHFVAWEPHVPGLCLEVQAVKSRLPSIRR